MHRDTFIRLKRAGPPSDPKSEHELMVFSSEDGRAGQVDHNDVFHLFAWVDEISGGDGLDWGNNVDTDSLGLTLRAQASLDLRSTQDVSLLDTGGGGIYLTSEAGSHGGGFIGIESAGELFLKGTLIVARLQPDEGDFEFQRSGTVFARFTNEMGFWMSLGSGESFEIGSAGTPLLRLDSSGQLHLPSGMTIAYDL